MKISWFGYCTFLLQDSFGRRIITDPYNILSAQKLISYNPKIITLSHDHTNEVSSFLTSNNVPIINKADLLELDYISIKGFNTYHDNLKGIKRGKNIIYLYYFDNIKICHLGHLGHIPSKDILNKLNDIDILFIPIGGNFTLNGLEASKLTDIINPKIVIPMHYRNNNILKYLDSPKNFIFSRKDVSLENNFTFDTNSILDFSYTKSIILKQSLLI